MNFRVRTICSAAAFGLLMVNVAHAQPQTQRGGWAAEGEGLTSCADFEKAYKAAPNQSTTFFAWAQGYLSGMDQMLKSEGEQNADLGLWNEEKQVQFISTYCAANPKNLYGDAATQLFLAMKAQEGIASKK